MAQEWYIDAGGRVEGPLPVSELRDRASAGRLTPTDRISADGVKWVPAGSIPGLTFPPTKPRQPLLETVVSGSVHLDDQAAAASPAGFSPLDSVPGYELQGTLGTGACGVVYRARQLKLNRVVALKTVLMAEKTSADIIARFEQEAVSLARLQHPNIVAVYDCGHTNGRAYFAMELLDGEDLDARLGRTGPLDERTAWLIARQTAAALAHAANLGVIHRDIKPANLFLVPPPTGFPLPPGVPMVKVTDFGLALTRGGPDDTDQRQTAAGVVLGTPVYMAPEQFSGSDVDPRADIYSLGATVYHVLTGQPPFDGRTLWEVMKKKALPAPRLQPPFSAETADLVAAMMATDAANRPSDYADLITRIDALPCMDGATAFSTSGRITVLPSAATPTLAFIPIPPPPVARRARWVYAVAAIALLGTAVGVAALAGAFKRPASQTKAPETSRPARTYTTGAQDLLYVSGSLAGWTPTGGPAWQIEQDDAVEQTQVLAGKGGVVRAFNPPPNFRVTLSLDPHKATTVEVVIATTDGPPATATRWLVRLDINDGAAFGKRVGPAGDFVVNGSRVPLPTRKELAEEGRRPYLEVKYERADGTLSAWFRDKPLGTIPDTGLKTTELRIQAIGGATRIDYAVIEELIEQK